MKFLREPLVQFLLLGALPFGVFAMLGRRANEQRAQVVITPGLIENLKVSFTRNAQRPPTAQELDALIEDYVREELLCREARAMGLDQDDPVVRRRLRQRMDADRGAGGWKLDCRDGTVVVGMVHASDGLNCVPEKSVIMPRQKYISWIGLYALLCARSVCGHDPFEITANARLRPDGLELKLTMSRSTAMSSCKNGQPQPLFEPSALETARPILKEGGANLFEITDGGNALIARDVQVNLTVEEDVEFRVSYPRPAKGPLQFRASFLTRMPPGYGATLYVSDEKNVMLKWELLMEDNLTLEVPLPPHTPVPSVSQPASSNSVAAGASPSGSSTSSPPSNVGTAPRSKKP